MTARVTRATDRAERLGILVVDRGRQRRASACSTTPSWPQPTDATCWRRGRHPRRARADFSSNGPTTDFPGRIKPDVMAPGVGVTAADVVHDSSYTRVDGTSLATPLVAGVAALLLSVHDATPAQLRDALRLTASNAMAPDNSMGWGIVNALAAYQYLVGLFPTDAALAVGIAPALRFANPYANGGSIGFALPAAAAVTLPRLRCHGTPGARPAAQHTGCRPASARIPWDGTDDAGRALPTGVYFVELRSAAAAPARRARRPRN